MAATRSAQRSGAKKRTHPKRAASKKKPAKARAKARAKLHSKKKPGKARAKARAKPHSKKKGASMITGLRRRARKGLKAARKGVDRVIKAGEKSWKMLKTRTKP